MSQLVLSLFPGADLLGMAFELEGFTVVQGPDVMFGRDIRNFHVPGGRFDGIIGGPPCQAFSPLQRLQAARGIAPRHGNLIPEFERILYEADPRYFVMENVPAAPEPMVKVIYGARSFLVRDDAVGGLTERERRFTIGIKDHFRKARLHVEELALHCADPHGAVTSSDGGRGVDMERYAIADMIALHMLPPDFLMESPFTADAKRKLLGNGVPLPMGRAVARAVKGALGIELVAPLAGGSVPVGTASDNAPASEVPT